MHKIILWFNMILLWVGIGCIYYIITNINPSESPIWVIWPLIACVVSIVWSLTAFIGFYVRMFLFRNTPKHKLPPYILRRAERQGLLWGLLVGLSLLMQGFLLWNPYSVTIIVIAVFLLEFFFIAQETK